VTGRPEGPEPDPSNPLDAPGGHDRRLRPAPFSGLFEIGVRLLRRHSATLLVIAVVFTLPGALLTAMAGVQLTDTVAGILPDLSDDAIREVVLGEAELRQLGDALLLVLGASVVAGVLGAIAMAADAWVVSRDYHGLEAPAGTAAGVGLRRAVSVIATLILSTLGTLLLLLGGVLLAFAAIALFPPAQGGGGLGVFAALVVAVGLTVGVIYLTVRWCLAVIVVALEATGPVSALRRSWHLTGDHAWRTFGVLAVLALLVSILSAVIAQLAISLYELASPSIEQARIVETMIVTGVTVLFAPVTPVVLAVLYHDLRVRRDDWDLPAPVQVSPAEPGGPSG
jgi:hypothetical protein